MICNNVVRKTGKDYQQATGINIFAARGCKVYHNDVSDIAYTAVHARIGDSGGINPAIGKLEFKYNRVSGGFEAHKWGIQDGGHFYLHGRYPDSDVSENYSRYANHNLGVEYYPDKWTIDSKWHHNISRDTQAEKIFFAHHNSIANVTWDEHYSDGPNGKDGKIGFATETNFHLIKEHQWPPEAQKIMDNAGLEPQWRHLTKKLYDGENLAQGKRCWASSEKKGFEAKNANDSIWSTPWWSEKGDKQAFWAVDLGVKTVIQRLTIVPMKYEGGMDGANRRNLEVQASNDPDFKHSVVLYERGDLQWYFKQGRSSTDMMEQYLPVIPAYRYLRVKRTSTTEALNIGEFAVYGYQTK